MEIWKIIDDYPEYEVSTYGNIRSIDRIFIDSIGRKYYKRGSISSCCNGNIKYVKNYIFKFH